MAYNRKAHLLTNTEAIRIAFALDREKRSATEAERAVLQQYSGFGGIKCTLKPAATEQDKAYWTQSDLPLFPHVAGLHRLIRENSKDERQYKEYFSSLKTSVLTAFYTPPEIVKTLADALKENGITSVRFLEPSAGSGAFVDAFRQTFPNMETTCFEKDLLTGKILSHLNPDDRVHIRGFEEIENRPDNRFDVVASNIPFGDTAVFDTSFNNSRDVTRRQATRAVHNYFFMKGIDSLREGGLLAFITSQGVMNSPSNEPVRHWLMDNTSLVSAVRLPNNLMSNNAGTEVGSDLVILQKNTVKTSLTPAEEAFIKSRTLSSGANINNYFQDFSRVVHTRGFPDKDLYGKPGMVFLHEGGITGMAAGLGKMLSADFANNLNRKLYADNIIATPKPEGLNDRMTLEELHEIDEAVKAVRAGKWDEFAARNPHIQENNRLPEEANVSQSQLNVEQERKSTAWLDWEEHSLGFDDLFPAEDDVSPNENKVEQERKSTAWLDWEEHSLGFDDLFPPENFAGTEISQKEKAAPPAEAKPNVQQQPLMTLYDLFNIPERERTQVNTKKRNGGKRTGFVPRPQQSNLFSQTPKVDTTVKSAESQAIIRHEDHEEQQRKLQEPRPCSGKLEEHHRQGSMVVEQNGQIGFLKERYREDAVFKSLELNPLQEQKAKLYIELRDSYHRLYTYEATERKANSELRQSLNEHYDTFVKRYGHLNDRKNLDLIKMDAGGREILSLERPPLTPPKEATGYTQFPISLSYTNQKKY